MISAVRTGHCSEKPAYHVGELVGALDHDGQALGDALLP
jgi:hypothetical protein